MRAVLAGVVIALTFALLGAAGAGARAPTRPQIATKKAASKVKCRTVAGTKARKRHRVCVKVKARRPAAKQPTRSLAPRPNAPVPSPATAAPAVNPLTPPTDAPVAILAPPALDTPPMPIAARLQATAREFSLQLSRSTINNGSLIVELVNAGEDEHDLHVRPATGGSDVMSIAGTEPFGGVQDASGTLAAGTYTLYCSLPGHEAAGMHATLTVR